jgi:DNA gyrase subunit A
LFTNLGKVYVIKAADIPAGGGFGEHVGKLLIMADGESLLAVTAPDPADSGAGAGQKTVEDDADSPEQIGLFEAESEDRSGSPNRGVLVTRRGYGFRFDYDTLREPTKRIGKRLVALKRGDDVVAVRPEDRDLVMVAADSGHALAFPVDQTVELSGPGLGVRFMKLAEDAAVVGLELFSATDELVFEIEGGATAVKAGSDIVTANRDGKGRRIFDKIGSLKRRV